MDYKLFFEEALKEGFEKVQITINDNNSRSVDITNDEVLYNNTDGSITYHIMALIDGNVVSVDSDYLDTSIISLLKEKNKIVEDRVSNIFLDDTSNNVDFNMVNSYIDINDTINELKSLSSLRDDLITKINSSFGASTNIKRIVNSDGVDISTSKTTYDIYISLINESDDKNTTVSKSKLSVNNDFDFKQMVLDLKEELKIKIKEEDINTGKYNCIIKPSVLRELLRIAINGLYIEKIHEKTSYLEGKLNKEIFSPLITIVEDPLNKDYPGYSLFDDEGTFTFKKMIVDKGILKTYLYDNKNALKDKTKSTGNAFNGLVRNCYVVPENNSFDDLVKKLDNGLIIDDCMGYHASVKINNGVISLQAFGMIVRDGKIVSSFKPVVMTTTYEELFGNVLMIGNDLEFVDVKLATPSMLIKDISIAGK